MKKLMLTCIAGLGFIGLGLFTTTDSASAAEWYNPIWFNSNIECQKGYNYGPNTLKNGKCRILWDGVVNDTIANMTEAFVSGMFGNRN